MAEQALTPEEVIGRRIRLTGHFADPVIVEAFDDYGPVVNLRVRTVRGEPKDATVNKAEFEQACELSVVKNPLYWMLPFRGGQVQITEEDWQSIMEAMDNVEG